MPRKRSQRLRRPPTSARSVPPQTLLLDYINDGTLKAKVQAALNNYTEANKSHPDPNPTALKAYIEQCSTAFLNLSRSNANKDEIFRIFREQSKTYCDKTCNRSYKETIIRNLWTVLYRPGFALLGLHGLQTLSESESFLGIASGAVVLPYMLAITGGGSLIACFYYLYKKNYEALLNSLTTAFMALTVGLALLMPIPAPIVMLLVTIYICTKLLVSLYSIYSKQNALHVANPGIMANPLQKASAELSNALIDAVQAEAKVKESSASKSKGVENRPNLGPRERPNTDMELLPLRRAPNVANQDSIGGSVTLTRRERAALTRGELTALRKGQSSEDEPTVNDKRQQQKFFNLPKDRNPRTDDKRPTAPTAPTLTYDSESDED